MQFLVHGMQTSTYIIKAFLQIYIYIMSSFDVIVYDFVLILMTIQLQSTCLNHARIWVLFTHILKGIEK